MQICSSDQLLAEAQETATVGSQYTDSGQHQDPHTIKRWWSAGLNGLLNSYLDHFRTVLTFLIPFATGLWLGWFIHYFSLSSWHVIRLFGAMVGNCYSEAADSLIKSISDRPVVPEANCNQPFSAFNPTPTCVPVMFESCHAPNIIPVSATPSSLLRSCCSRDVPTHLTDEFYHRHHVHPPVGTSRQFSVF